MTRPKKTVYLVLAALVTFLVILGIFMYAFGYSDKNDFSVIHTPLTDNYVEFRSNVHVADKPMQIRKNYTNIRVDAEEYTLIYENTIPDFFENIEVGEVFCVYPDSDAMESFFALGFCGKLTNISKSGENYYVSFTIPELTDVFKDISIHTRATEQSTVSTAVFYPNENVREIRCLQPKQSKQTLMCASIATASGGTMNKKKKSKSIDEFVDYRFREPQSKSLLEDYVLLCEELELEFDCEVTDEDGFSLGLSGDILLEETAIKMLLDYHYDEATDTVQLNDYSLGFITKQKVDLGLSAEYSIGLDDLDFDLIDAIQVVDIEDVTDAEEGKIVLGTYLIGLEAALPILQNDTNKVSYLSLGIAVQLTLTGKGEIGLEYNIEESGFAQIEVNSDGENTCLIKSYDYPNPVKENRQPTNKEISSVPSVTSEIAGKVNCNLAFGADVGVCVLGMVPVKLANNLVELEISKSFVEKEVQDEKVKIIHSNYLLDDNVDSLIISSNSQFKMHLGAKINFGIIKYKVAEMGGSIQVFKKVWHQTPPALGFSHSQCGFGGVFVGETYSDEELEHSFQTYMEETEKDGFLTFIKDSLLGSLVNAALNDLNLDPLDIASYLGEEVDNYKINYYTSGVIYVRDENDKVVLAFVIGEEITNISGVHNGLSSSKMEQVYSAPKQSAEVNISIGTLARELFDIEWLGDADIEGSVYHSCDSKEKMNLIFCNDSLMLIVVTGE